MSDLCHFCQHFTAKHIYRAAEISRDFLLCGRCDYWGDKRKYETAKRVAIGLPANPPSNVSPRVDNEHTRVYFIQSVNGGPIKIGWADHPNKRLNELQAGNPERLHIIGLIRGGHKKERELHRRFSHLRLRGEWFSPFLELVEFVENERIDA